MSSFPIRPRHTKGPSLYRNLRDNMVLQTSWNARYLPHSALKHVFPESVIASTLEKHQATFRIDISQLVSFISNRALKLFATLVWSGLEFLIEEFYDHNFDDDRLPVQLRYDENEGAVDVEAFTFKSNGLHAIENHPFGGESWTMRSLDQFSETDQWLFVSPVFHDRQFRYTLHDLCRMPFIEDENAIVREAYFSVLEQRRIHRDHLQISDLEVNILASYFVLH